MKHFLLSVLLLMATSLPSVAQELIIPSPQNVDILGGEFVFNENTLIYTTDSTQLSASTEFKDLMKKSASLLLKVTKKQPKKNAVCYKYNATLPQEGYRLKVTPSLITIEASATAGYFYGTQSLLQLMPSAIFSEGTNDVDKWSVSAQNIDDAPRFAYRGFMLDVSRYFLPKDKVLKLLDYMALHKLNKFHWHLVDDHGWRLEIKRYPLLTSVGAFRPERQQMFTMRNIPLEGEPTQNGGFYTQEDVKEIVAYAAQRCIEVIPEIEMPAHTNSSLAAYPQLACPIVDHYIGTLPGGSGQNASAIYCAGNDEVFDFLQNVIDEVVTLFPSSYIHIGGDEANKDNWEKCPKCQQRMKDNNIPNEEELQSYFIRRVNTYLHSKGKKLMGWDELVDSELPENSTIFGWRGFGNSAVKAAEKGHPIVLTPARICYFIRYQGPQWFEPFTSFGNNTLEDVYKYETEQSGITPELSHLVLGMQASLWTEFIYSWENLQYMIFPRLAALAENAWSTKPKDWSAFLKRMDHLADIYNQKGIVYATSMYNLDHKVKPRNGKLYASVSCIRPDVDIRYTTTGIIPDEKSPLYTSELEVNEGDLLQLATFKDDQRKGAILRLNTIFHKAIACDVTASYPNAFVLTNGLLGSERFSDGEYVELYDEDMSFTIDLGRRTDFSEIKIGTLLNAGLRACLPKSIRIECSDNNQEYTPLSTTILPDEAVFAVSFMKKAITINDFTPTTSRYVRFTLTNPGNCPENHPGSESQTRIAIDEVIIN